MMTLRRTDPINRINTKLDAKVQHPLVLRLKIVGNGVKLSVLIYIEDISYLVNDNSIFDGDVWICPSSYSTHKYLNILSKQKSMVEVVL